MNHHPDCRIPDDHSRPCQIPVNLLIEKIEGMKKTDVVVDGDNLPQSLLDQGGNQALEAVLTYLRSGEEKDEFMERLSLGFKIGAGLYEPRPEFPKETECCAKCSAQHTLRPDEDCPCFCHKSKEKCCKDWRDCPRHKD